jgi:outer membrane protein assembly factor BamA
MSRYFRACLCLLSVPALQILCQVRAQSPETTTAPLREVHAEGSKILTEAQVVSLTSLQLSSQVGKNDLQTAADRLVASGLFSKVSYSFQTRGTGVLVTYHVEESPRIPAYFDNIPWLSDAELGDAIRKSLPFFDGTLPEAGAVVDQAGDAVKELLASHGLQVTLEHVVAVNPAAEGNVQQFRVEGATVQISKLEFGDRALTESKVVQQHLPEIEGKAYSRMTIDMFLTEAIRPVYLQKGYLRVKLGPPEVRLSGNPNQKFPDRITVFVPVTPGEVFHWKEVRWTGNSIVSEFTLNALLRAKPGDLANGMETEAGWDRVREEYGHHGYLETKLDPVATFDEQTHTVSYVIAVQEGVQFHSARWYSRDFPLPPNASFTPPGPSPPQVSSTKQSSRKFFRNSKAIRNKSLGNCPCTMKPSATSCKPIPPKALLMSSWISSESVCGWR